MKPSQNPSGNPTERRPSFLKPAGILIGLAVGILVSLFSLLDFSDRLEHHAFDTFMKVSADPGQWPSEIAVLLIDENALQSQEINERAGRWPWRRSAEAGLVAYLKKAGARAVVFDILFPSPSEDAMEDDRFAAYLRAANNVWLAVKPQSPSNEKSILPITPFLDAVQSRIGFVHAFPDHDGVIRNYPLTDPTMTPSIPSLSESVAKELHFKIPSSSTFILKWYGPANTLPIYSVKEPVLTGFDLLNWIAKSGKPKDFDVEDSLQVAALIQGAPIQPDLRVKFENKIVFIGCVAAATYDSYSTPLEKHQSGVFVHATALANLIRQDFIVPAPDWIQCLMILASSLLINMICEKVSRVRFQILWSLVSIFILSCFSFILFNNHFWLPPVLAGIAGILSYTSITTYHYVVEGKQKRVYRQLFSDFVSPDVLDEVLSSPTGLDLHGDSRMGTVLFCDLAGFTTFTEMATPHQLIEAINTYLSEASKVLLNHGAYIDKFIGDAVMAIFNIPREQPDHAVQACFAALELQPMIRNLNDQLKKQYPEINLSLRVGVNSGNMIAGPMGYARKLNYSALGDSVNLASRLEGANKEYHTLLMIGPQTYELAKDHIEVRSLDFLRVKGKTKPVRVFELMARKNQLSPDQIKLRTFYQEGFEFYQSRKWKEAIQSFEQALNILPDDGPSSVYLERCQHYQQHPPPENWDGSFGLDTK